MSDRLDSLCMCAMPIPDPFELPAGLAQPRSEAIQVVAKRWDNGTELKFHFLASPRWTWPEEQKEAVRRAFEKWASLGLGLSFREAPVATGATLLIGRLHGDGSWSYLGTDVLTNRRNGCNMNFGWDLTDAWGRATALHEIGHALGMPHEHQNPQAGLVWDEAAVLAHYAGKPNFWEEATIRHNILRKLPASEITGSKWDPRSVMHYPIAPNLISAPVEWRTGTPENFELSPEDIAWVRRFYPRQQASRSIEAGKPQEMPTASGAMARFTFEPTESREFEIATDGRSDARLTVFSNRNGSLRPLAQADDAARDDNARVSLKLEAGETYVIDTRTYYADDAERVMLSVR